MVKTEFCDGRAGRFANAGLFFTTVLIGAVVTLSGCRTATPPGPLQGNSTSFNEQQVVALSHEAFRLAWDARFWARHDLSIAPFWPTALDREALEYLNRIMHHVPWVGRTAARHPSNPRAASYRCYALLRYDTMMFRRRYQPASFLPPTNAKIKNLLHIIDEIAANYGENASAAN